MPSYDFIHEPCGYHIEVMAGMSEVQSLKVICPCGGTCDRVYHSIPFTMGYAKSFGNENNGKGRFFSNLAQKMPKGKDDPKAFFTNQDKAEDYAKKLADTYGGSVEKTG